MLPIEHLTWVSGALSLRYTIATRLLLVQRVGSFWAELKSLLRLVLALFLLRHSRVHPLRSPVKLHGVLSFLVYICAAALSAHQPVEPRDTFVFLAFNLFLPAITILYRWIIKIIIVIVIWSGLDSWCRLFFSLIVILCCWDRLLLSFTAGASRWSVFLGQASGQWWATLPTWQIHGGALGRVLCWHRLLLIHLRWRLRSSQVDGQAFQVSCRRLSLGIVC